MIIVTFFIFLLMRIETEQNFLPLFFEVISAFGTVGLSMGLTPVLTLTGKLAIIMIMFIGRVGPLTMVLAIAQQNRDDGNYDYPEGRIMIG
jgi:trk system potassium uptake protein TrkH